MPNIERIPSPPGGQLVCSEQQLAIVRVAGGQVFAECHDKPKALPNDANTKLPPQYRNWVLSRVYNEARKQLQGLTPKDRKVWDARRYEYFDQFTNLNVVVIFSLPGDKKGPIDADGPTKNIYGSGVRKPEEMY